MKRAIPALVLFLSFIPAAQAADSATTNTSAPKAPKTNPLPANTDPLATLRQVEKINNDQAIKFFGEKIAKNPKDALSYARRGKAYSGNKDYEHALPDYDKAIELDPKLTDAYVGRAVIRLVNKEYDKCWEDVHKAESLGGQFWPSFMEALKEGSKRDK